MIDEATPVDASSGFRSLCEFVALTVISNGLPIDDDVAAQLTTTVAAQCNTTPIVRTVSQDDAGVLEPGTDRPLLPPDQLVVIGGGDTPNRALAYLLNAGATPLAWSGVTTASIRERSTNRLIASGAVSATHDHVMVMVIDEPIGGLRVLSGQGFLVDGTIAAGLWFAALSPPIMTNESRWAVVEWTDTDGLAGASDGDTFVLIETGS